MIWAEVQSESLIHAKSLFFPLCLVTASNSISRLTNHILSHQDTQHPKVQTPSSRVVLLITKPQCFNHAPLVLRHRRRTRINSKITCQTIAVSPSSETDSSAGEGLQQLIKEMNRGPAFTSFCLQNILVPTPTFPPMTRKRLLVAQGSLESPRNTITEFASPVSRWIWTFFLKSYDFILLKEKKKGFIPHAKKKYTTAES